MSTKLNLRFAHFPSRAPIMLELQVDPNTTVGQLRALVEQKLATEDHCLVRVFARWYLETRAGEVRRFSELTDAEAGSVLSAVGIEDECELYLEGPVMQEENGMWKALAIVSMQGRQAQAQQAFLVQSLLDEMHALKETQAMQGDILRSLRETLAEGTSTQKQELSNLKDAVSLQQKLAHKQIEKLADTQENQQQQFDTIAATQTKQCEALTALRSEIMDFQPRNLDQTTLDRANSLLIKHSGLALKALWEVLNEKESSVELAMAIVMDRRCGLERRSTLAEGEMKSRNGFVMNDAKKGGVTPLLMAALACRLDVMKALLAAGADVHAKEEGDGGLTALSVAAITNDPAAIELLVSYGADVNSGGSSPLHQAAWNGNLEAIEMLITKGADTRKENEAGRTPLKNFEQREKGLTWKSQAVKARIRELLTPK